MDDILLSICIPTYNGGDNLKVSLESLVEALRGVECVEVVVSDNGSDEYSQNVLHKYSNVDTIRIFRNSMNLGFNENCKLLIDKYARGCYCWIIGDDDFVNTNSIKLLCAFLNEKRPDFVSIGFRLATMHNYSIHRSMEIKSIEYSKGDYFSCIDNNASIGNILGTFMSTQIFLLSPVRKFDKSIFGDNTWKDYKNVFPNSYMMMSVFRSSNNCYCIKTPMLTAISHPKSWDDKFYALLTDILPYYLSDCYKIMGSTKGLTNNKRVLKQSITEQTIIMIKHQNFRAVKWKYVFAPFFWMNSVKLFLSR